MKHQTAPSIFREAALRRLHTPEQMDELLSVASPVNWLTLAAVFLAVGMVGAWAWAGSVTRTATAEGILVGSGGIVSVNAPGNGQITSLDEKPGDTVRANQVIARIGNPLLAEQVRVAAMTLADAENEAARSANMRNQTARLQRAANDSQQANVAREITELEAQAAAATEQVRQQEELVKYGLATKNALVAAQQKVASIGLEIERRRTQTDSLKADRLSVQAAAENARAEVRDRVAELSRRLTSLREELRQATSVTAAVGGEVIEVKAYAGAMVAAGAPLITVQATQGSLEALIYVPSSDAKYIAPGMEVQLSPSNTRRAENGYLLGTVVEVTAFPVTPTAISRRLENEAFTTQITSKGPVTELRVALRRDDSDPTGYQWSSRQRGRMVALSSGALCSAEIVTVKQRPLSLAIPALKEALGVH